MRYSNKINLLEFIHELNECDYVIIKIWDNFPNYYPQSDLDIFCTNINLIAEKILTIGNKYLDQEFKININESENYHKQIDFIYMEQIDFRFDLFGSFPDYKNVNIKNSYLYSVIDNKVEKLIGYNNKEIKVFIPCVIDEMIVRYLDYLEYFVKRKDKIRHLDFIRNGIIQNANLESFLDRFYNYISLPIEKKEYSFITKNKLAVIDVLRKVKNKGILGSIKKVLLGN
jgi:hypothetical protein